MDVQTGLASASVVPSKECSTYSITELKKFIYESGRTYGSMQSDQEASITAILKAVTREIGGLSLRHAPKGSSQSQGAIERFHSTMFAQARALRIQTEINYQTKINPTMPIATWIIKHAVWLLNRYSTHSDGLTSYQRRWSQSYQSPLCEFPETVMFRIPTTQGLDKKKYESRWFHGLYLGRDATSNEILVGASTEVSSPPSL